MGIHEIERHFNRIGTRAKFRSMVRGWPATRISIDIGHDKQGEFFDVTTPESLTSTLQVLDVQPKLRHLLLMSRQDDGKHKFLCGHDERHWFVAAVPEKAAVSTVKTAFDALKPLGVRARESRVGLKPSQRNLRRNEAFVRQGEWFFVPVANSVQVDERLIIHDEPLARSGGKPHRCEEIVRQGGELVYVCGKYPRGLTERQHQRLLDRDPSVRHLHWVTMRRNPGVFVRGRVRHSDHKTIVLNGWHQVLMNTENESLAMRHVAFLD